MEFGGFSKRYVPLQPSKIDFSFKEHDLHLAATESMTILESILPNVSSLYSRNMYDKYIL